MKTLKSVVLRLALVVAHGALGVRETPLVLGNSAPAPSAAAAPRRPDKLLERQGVGAETCVGSDTASVSVPRRDHTSANFTAC